MLLTFGRNVHGELGRPVKQDETTETEQTDDISTVRNPSESKAPLFQSVASGHFHCLALSSDDSELYSWGAGNCGQTGFGDTGDTDIPTLIPALARQRSVAYTAAGRNHSLVCNGAGLVFSWGRDSYGQAGHGDRSDQMEPRAIRGLQHVRVTMVACGEAHSLALTENCMVFAWGRGSVGQLGIGTTTSRATPQLIETLNGRRTSSIAAGYHHSIALTESGECYTWGGARHGQLGHPSKENELRPRLVEALQRENIAAAAAGQFHSLVKTQENEIFSFGSGSSGQLGVDSLDSSSSPQLVSGIAGLDIKLIACGACFSIAITQDGEAWGWGGNDYGQQGTVPCSTVLTPTKANLLSKYFVSTVACGSYHTVFIVNSK